MKALKSMFQGRTLQAAVTTGLMVGVSAAQAAVDVSTVTAALADAATTVGTIGAAALGVVVVVKVFKYIRGAF